MLCVLLTAFFFSFFFSFFQEDKPSLVLSAILRSPFRPPVESVAEFFKGYGATVDFALDNVSKQARGWADKGDRAGQGRAENDNSGDVFVTRLLETLHVSNRGRKDVFFFEDQRKAFYRYFLSYLFFYFLFFVILG